MRNASFLAVLAITSACGTAAKRAPLTEIEPGADACRITVQRDGTAGVIELTRDGGVVRELEDLDGDGQVDTTRRRTHDRSGRLTTLETLAPDGATVLARDTYVWSENRIARIDRDRFTADGEAGVDGKPDEIHTYRWDGDRLVAEEIDQVDAAGLLGGDGKPDLVTTWVWENGERRVGTRVDRDGAVLQVERLAWANGQLARNEVDLGGDGVVDVTISNTYDGRRLVRVRVEGELETAQLSYEYCR